MAVALYQGEGDFHKRSGIKHIILDINALKLSLMKKVVIK
jgi:hypothetical protein